MTKTMMALFAATLMTSPALADTDTPTTVGVNIDARDLDLNSADGRELLDARIGTVARQVCRRAYRSDGLAPYHARYCERVVVRAATARRDAMLAEAGTDTRFLGMTFTVTFE